MSKTTRLLVAFGSLLPLVLGGCDPSADATVEDEARADAPREPFSSPAGAQSLTSPPAHASAVRLLLEGAAVSPWCGGVLVAPDVVVTATACVEGRGTSKLSVALSDGAVQGIDDVEVLTRDDRLSALVLEAVAGGIAPADVLQPDTAVCDVHSISHLFVPDGEPVEWWTWSGCYAPDTNTLRVVEGAPNCHGDNGAPAYLGDEGLLGVVVGATAGDTCVHAVILAGPESGAYEEAMALSRPAL